MYKFVRKFVADDSGEMVFFLYESKDEKEKLVSPLIISGIKLSYFPPEAEGSDSHWNLM